MILALAFVFQTIMLQAMMAPSRPLSVCRSGTAEQVLTMLSEGPHRLVRYKMQPGVHLRAQKCFEAALKGDNLTAVQAIVNEYSVHLEVGLLELPCTEGRMELVKVLLSQRLNLSGYEIRAAVEGDQLEVIKMLLQDGRFDPAAHHNAALMEAAVRGNFEIFKLLLSQISVDQHAREAAFLVACRSGHLSIVRLLCESHRVDPRVQDDKAIIKAAGSGNLELVLYLEARGANPGAQESEALSEAARAGRRIVLQHLLACPGVDPAARKNRPLQTASYFEQCGLVDLLLLQPAVIKALDAGAADRLMRNPASGQTKLTLLRWMSSAMGNMKWIPVYQEFCLKYPKANFDHVKDRAIAELRTETLVALAGLVESWAAGLKSFSVIISGRHDALLDTLEVFLEKYL